MYIAMATEMCALLQWLGQLSLWGKSSTSFGCGKGGNVTSAGWQVTLGDLIWHVSFRNGEAGLLTKRELLLHSLTGTLLFLSLQLSVLFQEHQLPKCALAYRQMAC